MPSAVTTTTRELPESRVRVDVEVEPKAVEREIQGAAGELGGDLRIPGFRKGKVPPQVVLQRVGREAVLDHAVRRGLPAWYEAAVAEAGIATVGEPKLDLDQLPDKGAPLAFSIEVGVRPPAELAEYKGLEVGRREAEATDEQIDAELERLRESAAALENVERPAADGDFVVLDFVGTIDGEPFEGGEARGQVLELGSGRLVPGFESQLEGAEPGSEREVEITFPDDYANDELAGKLAVFATTVKEVKQKRLPELDDEFALEAGGLDTLAELREDLSGRLVEAHERQIDGEYREAVVDSAAEAATIDVPKELVHAKAHDMWHATERRLASRGLDPAHYLQLTGKTEEELVGEAEPEAERALKRESVLAAVVETEAIEVGDDEVLDTLRAAAAAAGEGAPSERSLERSLKKAKANGGDEALREDIAMRKAVDLLVEHAKPIPVEQAKARDKLWTPDKEEESSGTPELWTPGA